MNNIPGIKLELGTFPGVKMLYLRHFFYVSKKTKNKLFIRLNKFALKYLNAFSFAINLIRDVFLYVSFLKKIPIMNHIAETHIQLVAHESPSLKPNCVGIIAFVPLQTLRPSTLN